MISKTVEGRYCWLERLTLAKSARNRLIEQSIVTTILALLERCSEHGSRTRQPARRGVGLSEGLVHSIVGDEGCVLREAVVVTGVFVYTRERQRVMSARLACAIRVG